MIINSQRTMYGINLQMDMLLGKPHKSLVNTTLNEKFQILPLKDIPEGTYPKLNYIVVGIGGNDIIDDSAYKFSKHRSIDAALFKHVPFVIRTLDNDLLPEDRIKYRLRRLEIINGIEYVVYYAKAFTGYTCRDGLFEISSRSDVHTLEFLNTNSSEFLNPIPRLVEDYLDIDNRTYTAKTVKVEFSLDQDELKDMNDAMLIKYGEVYPLTEIGICSGIEDTVDEYPEVNNCVINYFVEVNIDTTMYLLTNDNILRSIEIGSLELTIK